MNEHLHGPDTGVVAPVDLGRLSVHVAREVRDVVILPVAQLYRTSLALCSVRVRRDDRLVLRRP